VRRLLACWIGVPLLAALCTGCAITPGDGSYGYAGSVGFGLDYYEPWIEPGGAYYGGWGPGYSVAPYRGGERRIDRGPGPAGRRDYRPAPGSRPMPSIPSRHRGGAPGKPRGH
jgi:hypothetical protein